MIRGRPTRIIYRDSITDKTGSTRALRKSNPKTDKRYPQRKARNRNVSDVIEILKLIKYAFKTYAVDEIIATTLASNEASMNMLLKNNFIKGKVLENDRFLDGKYVDSVQFVLKREDYIKNKQT